VTGGQWKLRKARTENAYSSHLFIIIVHHTDRTKGEQIICLGRWSRKLIRSWLRFQLQRPRSIRCQQRRALVELERQSCLSHSMCPGPFSRSLDSSLLVFFPPLSHIIRQRIIWIWSAQQCLYGEKNSSNLKCRRPITWRRDQRYPQRLC
jgi:hypothetical protein